MTSVPTWLAVLAPVMAALPTAGAAIVGVVLGGRAARRTAERSAALSREDEQRRWNRERREKAYTALVEARDRYVKQLDTKTWAVAPFPNDLLSTLGQVQLYGSEAARDAAVQWVGVLVLMRDAAASESIGVKVAAAPIFAMWGVNRTKEWFTKHRTRAEQHKAEEKEQALRFQALIRNELGTGG